MVSIFDKTEYLSEIVKANNFNFVASARISNVCVHQTTNSSMYFFSDPHLL